MPYSRTDRQFSAILLSTVLIVLAWPVPTANAYYCDDNFCSADQFCCGENICCAYANNTSFTIICVFISVIVFGIVLWGFFQLLLALIAIYFGDSRRNDHHLPGDVEHQQRHGFVADIENGDFSLANFIKRFLNATRSACFNWKKVTSRPYLYSPHASKQSTASGTASLMAYKEEHEENPFH